MIDDYVTCPICNKKFRTLQSGPRGHLGKHGYATREDFLKDYPGTKLVSDYVKEVNSITGFERNGRDYRRKQSAEAMKKVSTELFKDKNYKEKYKQQKLDLWKDEEYKNLFIQKRWTEERRKELSLRNKEMNKRLYSNPEYKERNLKQILSIGGIGKHYHYKGKYLKSSWELKVLTYLDENNIPYEYETLRIKYKDQDNKEHTYIPDLYFKSINTIVEIKPKHQINDIENILKREYSLKENYNYKYLTQDHLKHLDKYFNILLERATTIESISN